MYEIMETIRANKILAFKILDNVEDQDLLFFLTSSKEKLDEIVEKFKTSYFNTSIETVLLFDNVLYTLVKCTNTLSLSKSEEDVFDSLFLKEMKTLLFSLWCSQDFNDSEKDLIKDAFKFFSENSETKFFNTNNFPRLRIETKCNINKVYVTVYILYSNESGWEELFKEVSDREIFDLERFEKGISNFYGFKWTNITCFQKRSIVVHGL